MLVMKKSAFTLMEILIVVVLFGLLSGIIIQSYVTISRIGLRMEQDKTLAKESLLLTQILQNIAAEATIDYDRYEEEKINLQEKKGIIEKLYLTWWQRTGVQISSVGDCELSARLYDENYLEKKEEKTDFSSCRLVLKQGDREITLLGGGNFLLSKISFKIIPYQSNIHIQEELNTFYEENPDKKPENIPQQGKPWFWLLGALYSKFYNPKQRSTSSILPLQFFFGLQGSTPQLYDLETTDEN